jgi:hypothetical protein
MPFWGDDTNGEHFKTGADSDSLILIKVLEAFDRAMNMLGQWRRQPSENHLRFEGTMAS